MESHFNSIGLKSDAIVERGRSLAKAYSEQTQSGTDVQMRESSRPRSKSAVRANSSIRGMSQPRSASSMAFKDEKSRERSEIIRRRSMKKRNEKGLKGEADRTIGNLMPKHLFSGKRGIGKNERR